MKHIFTFLFLLFSIQLIAQNKLTFIKIERTPCYGKCPSYSVELKPDGKLIYNGRANVKMLGTFDGQISKEKAARIFKNYEKNNFLKLQNKYVVLATDLPSLIVEVVQNKTSKKILRADAGPSYLRQLGADMDELVQTVQWKGREGSEIVDDPMNPDMISDIETVYEFIPALYPGGEKAMNDFIHSNLSYPNIARVNKIEGNVVCKFIIDKNGKPKNIEVVKGIGYSCDDEAQRIISNMPNWTPAYLNGKIVNAYQTISIPFKLK